METLNTFVELLASTLSARLMHRVEKKKKKDTKPVQANKLAKKQKLYSIVFTITSINYRLPIWNLFVLHNLSHLTPRNIDGNEGCFRVR